MIWFSVRFRQRVLVWISLSVSVPVSVLISVSVDGFDFGFGSSLLSVLVSQKKEPEGSSNERAQPYSTAVAYTTAVTMASVRTHVATIYYINYKTGRVIGVHCSARQQR